MDSALVSPATGNRLRTLHSSWLGRIEDFSAPGDFPAPRGHSPEYQLVFPYAGAFEYHLGAKTAFLDATRVLFVGAGEDYADVHVAGHGHDSIIITPRPSLLQELSGHAVPSRHPAFRCVTKPTTPRMNLRNHRLLRLDTSGNDPLARDELMIALLDEALGPARKVVRASPLRAVDAAKQFLHAHLCEPFSLNEIAHAVQVSGAYLTDAFTRSEGVPLCHYRMRLRLNRALVDLPRCEDLTGLALDLGFSSHAHFSNSFKSLFGASPSVFRRGCGKSRRAVRTAPGSRADGTAAERRDGASTQKKKLKAMFVSLRQDGPDRKRRSASKANMKLKGQPMRTFIRKTWLPVTASVVLAAGLAGCGGSDGPGPAPVSQVPQLPLDPQLVAAGQQTFRFDTFGDETFWTDTLKMNTVIESAVDPLTAASVGLKIDAAALPAAVVTGVMDGSIPLNDPQTTLALLSLDAVVGVKGQVSKRADGKLQLDRVGITCALCHSTVSRDLQITAPGLAGARTNLAGIVGNRLDGWPNRDLLPGTIISLSPALTAGQKAEYASWATLFGPGFYDPRINVNTDPGSNPAVKPDIDANIAAYKAAGGIPVVIPAALGLVGLDKSIFTGDGDTAHEPAGPVSYWNRYVGVVQMHGHGTFSDERLIINGQPLSVDHRVGDDLITAILPQLEAYQWSIAAPTVGVDGTKWDVASDLDAQAVTRGKAVFEGQAKCATCHSGPSFTDVNTFGLHPASASVALDKKYIEFSATKQWRTTPLKGIWMHPPYFHDGSGALNAATGRCMDGSDIGSLTGATDRVRQDLACVVNRYNDPKEMNLGLTDTQRVDLVEFLKSL